MSDDELNSKININKSPLKRKRVDITYDSIKEEEYEPSSKIKTDMKIKNKGMNIMVKMGYTLGEGLGAQNQGIKDPVSASTKMDRQGLGLTVADLGIEQPDTVWAQGADEASATGDFVFTLEGERLFSDSIDLASEIVIGERVTSIEEETRYCDPFLLNEMIKCKNVLDQHRIFTDGRSRSNAYEKIGSGIFLNRAAMKMANLDYITDNLFTTCSPGETLFFADICAGPGGFTEYMLWRRPMTSCGFGFTLRDSNDFKLKDIICGPVECFHPSYGKNDDGDIFNEDNLRRFQLEVYSSTDGLGVHTVLADGGFSVEGQENIQEVLSKQLYLCQFLCAINILRIGGNFVCKLFDVFTDFSVGLIHLLSHLFLKVAIVKPITSRPANSERYIVFTHFTDRFQRLELTRDYLYYINRTLSELKCGDSDIIGVVSRDTLESHDNFLEFIRESNDKILSQQIISLAKLHAFIKDRNLIDDRQHVIRTEALELWNVPDETRAYYRLLKLPESVKTFVNIDERNFFDDLREPAKKSIKYLTEDEFRKDKFALRNHYAGFLSHSVAELKQSTYVLLKDRKVVKWYPESNSRKPEKLTDVIKKWVTSLPSFTILLVHFGVEFSGGKGNLKYNSITVLDSVLVYGEDISSLSYDKRMEKVDNLCNLLDPKHKGHIKPLDYFPLEKIFDHLKKRLSIKRAKGVKEQEMVSVLKGDHFFPPAKLFIINFVKDSWIIARSKSRGNTYYYNVHSRESLEEQPADLFASYSESHGYEVDWTDSAGTLEHTAFLSLLSTKL